jgi:HEAT repeat protein
MTGPAEPDESVRLLATLLDSDRGGPGEDALLAIALHADPAADAELERQLVLGSPAMRSRAAFWLAAERGERGARVLIEHFAEEKDEDVRQELVFPLYVADREVTDRELVRIARRDPLAGVRQQALFWIAQRAGESATDVLEDAVGDDPQSEVRQHAVFAISQLPPDRAVPLLIDLAESHRDPEVRRRSIFWLGEIDDPRATEYLISLVE